MQHAITLDIRPKKIAKFNILKFPKTLHLLKPNVSAQVMQHFDSKNHMHTYPLNYTGRWVQDGILNANIYQNIFKVKPSIIPSKKS